MTDEQRLPGPKEAAFKKILSEMVDEAIDRAIDIAIEAERNQAAERVRHLGTSDMQTFVSRREAIEAILSPDKKPDELTTIEKLIKRVLGGTPLWAEEDLTALVQGEVEAQARRDAEIVCAHPHLSRESAAKEILKSAGLK